MDKPQFNEGDEVVVTDGDFKGQYGVVQWYEEIFGTYMVRLPEIHETGYFSVKPDEMVKVDEADIPDEDSEEEVDEILVPGFGMSPEEFKKHLEYLLMRSLDHVGKVGPDEAFFGFQEFEGMTPAEILVSLMIKLEEGMAMFAQAHILIGRTIIAMENQND